MLRKEKEAKIRLIDCNIDILKIKRILAGARINFLKARRALLVRS